MESITITRADLSTELEALARVGFRAFRQTANADGWARYLRDNTAIHAGETYVARRDGAIVGHASHLALTMQLVGTELSVAGVAGVSVLPEARRAGVADAMMRALLDGMRVRNTPLSMLYAFRLGYYARFGYATMAGPEQVRAAPAQFPASPLRAHVRPVEPQAALPVMRPLYDRWRQGRTGPLLRDDWWWQTRVLRGGYEVVTFTPPGSDEPEGYMVFTVPSSPEYPRQHLEVWELVYLTPRARAGLLGFLNALGEQYACIILDVAPGAAALVLREHGLHDAPDDWLFRDPLAFVSTGPMARLVDLPAAFAQHPTVARTGLRGTLGLTLHDPLLSSPARWTARFDGAKGTTLTPGLRGRHRLSLTVGALTQVYLASATATALREHGTVEGDAESAALLDAALAGPTLFQPVADGF